jgi:hypothetical protein
MPTSAMTNVLTDSWMEIVFALGTDATHCRTGTNLWRGAAFRASELGGDTGNMPDTDANGETEAYWKNLLGFKVDPWLSISDSALKECYTALGVVTARWNSSESMMRLFAAHYIQLPEKFAPVIMRHFNNVGFVDLLADGATAIEKDNPEFLEALKFLCALYLRCRENRNDVIHSRQFPIGSRDCFVVCGTRNDTYPLGLQTRS